MKSPFNLLKSCVTSRKAILRPDFSFIQWGFLRIIINPITFSIQDKDLKPFLVQSLWRVHAPDIPPLNRVVSAIHP